MKKLLLFIIVVFALLSIDHPVIKEPRDKIFNTFMSDLSDSSKVNREVKAKRALEAVTKSIDLSAPQMEHLSKALRTNNGMYNWHLQYCKKDQLNEYFYGDDLLQVCEIINSQLN